MNPILQVFYSVISGLTLAMALPNELFYFGSPVLALFSAVPFYFAIRDSKNYKLAFLNGFIYSCSTHLASSFWLANFKDFAALTLGASAFGTAMIGGSMALFMYLPFSSSKSRNPLHQFSLHQKLTDTVTFRIIYFAALYTLYEWVKSCGFLGYPWGTFSSTIFRWPELMQLASITGTYGISFLLLLVNGFIAETLSFFLNHNHLADKNRFRDLAITGRLTLILFALALIHGFYNYNKKITPQKTLQTIIVQQNSDPWKEKDDDVSVINSENLTKEQIEILKSEGTYPELVVWSEGTLRYRFPDSVKHYNRYPADGPLIPFIRGINVPLLTGGSYTKDKKNKIYFNAAVLFDRFGNYRGIYGKNHLVPFAEALPGMEIPAVKNFMAKVVGISAGWTPGDQYVLFDIPCTLAPKAKLPAVKEIDISVAYEKQMEQERKAPTVKISAPICYDDAFPDIMRPLFLAGTELYVNLTDDSWSLKKSSEYQHCVVASYRSIEYRTTMIRSCNAGYSVVINPQGRIIADMPLFEMTAISCNVPIYERKMTTYARFGNWLPWTFFVLFIAFAVYMHFAFEPTDYIPNERILSKKSSKKKADKKKDSKDSKKSKKKADKKSEKKDSKKNKKKNSKHKK